MPDELKAFEEITVWTRGEQRAPHKPLLLLLALGRVQQDKDSQMLFEEIEPLLRTLLAEFGPYRSSYHPEYPFWHLQDTRNALWILNSEKPLKLRPGSSNPSKTELIKQKAKGTISPSVIRALRKKPELICKAAKKLLTAHFPESVHEEITNAVGLNIKLDQGNDAKRSRDPKFREAVLIAYEYKCALCGMDIYLSLGGSNSLSIGLEAAHIKWHQAGGEDILPNGLALCSIHHKLLDYGAYTILNDYRV